MIIRCPVEIPIGGLNEPRQGDRAVRAPALGAKTVQRRQLAAQADFEDRAVDIAVGPAVGRGPVQVPIGGLDERGIGRGSVRAAALRAESVYCRQLAGWCDLEDGPTGPPFTVLGSVSVWF
jgi:hypothetical protein